MPINICQLNRGRGRRRTKVSQDQVFLEVGGGGALVEEPIVARRGGADYTGSTGSHPTSCGNIIAEVHRPFDYDGQARANRRRHLEAHRRGKAAGVPGEGGQQPGGSRRLALLVTSTGRE